MSANAFSMLGDIAWQFFVVCLEKTLLLVSDLTLLSKVGDVVNSPVSGRSQPHRRVLFFVTLFEWLFFISRCSFAEKWQEELQRWLLAFSNHFLSRLSGRWSIPKVWKIYCFDFSLPFPDRHPLSLSPETETEPGASGAIVRPGWGPRSRVQLPAISF